MRAVVVALVKTTVLVRVETVVAELGLQAQA
jgi:hypothetical protein